MFASILAALIAVVRAIPVLADLVKSAAEAWNAHEKAANEAEALKRKSDKDAAVDAAVDRWVRVGTSPARQQQAADGTAGLPAGGASGAGMGSGQPQNDQRAGS